YVFQNGVGFTDELHVAVLDAVVNHFDVVTGAIRSHVAATRFAIDLFSDSAKDWRDYFPGFARTNGHQRRTFERAFLSTGNTASDEMNPATFEIFAAPLRIGEQRITAVDNDVAFFEKWCEFADYLIDRIAGFDHDHGFARFFKRTDKFFKRARRLDIFSFGTTGCEFLSYLCGPIKNGDRKSLGIHIQDEVFAHYSQPDEANIALIRSHFGSPVFQRSSSRSLIVAIDWSEWQTQFVKF